MKFFFSLIALFIGIYNCFPQNIVDKGTPSTFNYLPETYGNHGKIWDISSAKNGLIYMASENGLLEFDGQSWNNYSTYGGVMRSIAVVTPSLIYTGSDMDFGVWRKDSSGRFIYKSMYPFKNKIGGTNEEFWQTWASGKKIFFVSHHNVYILLNNKLIKIKAPSRFTKSFKLENKIYFNDQKKGLLVFDGVRLKPIVYSLIEQPQIEGLYRDNNNLYAVSHDKGVYKINDGKLISYPSKINQRINENKVFSFIEIDGKYLAFGTITDGVYITDLAGNILQHLHKQNGLLNNTILSMHLSNGKLWMGLDYGITRLDLFSPFSYFQNQNNDFGSAETASIMGENLYIGTNQGLYYTSWKGLTRNQKADPFIMIPESGGQVWSLVKIDGTLLCGHDKGLYEVSGQNITKLSNEKGIATMVQIDEKTLLTGHYHGLSIYKKDGRTWKFFKRLQEIKGSVSQIIKNDNGQYWINLPNYGVINFTLNWQLAPIKRKTFLSRQFHGELPSLYLEGKTIKVFTSTSKYTFDNKRQVFLLDNELPKYPYINKLKKGIYKAKNLDENYDFYSTENGFALKDKNKRPIFNPKTYPILFKQSQGYNNDGSMRILPNSSLPYKYNNIRISFIVPNTEQIEYRFFLEGFSKSWSLWNKENKAQFLNLRDGKYRLLVEAKNQGKDLGKNQFHFTIKAPWYRTTWSILGYILIAVITVELLRQYQKKKLKELKWKLLKKEQQSLRKQAAKHRETMLQEKQKQLEIEKDNLSKKIKDKTIELALKAKEDEDNMRLLKSIADVTLEAEKNPNTLKVRLAEIRKLLKNHIEVQDNTFEIQMDELHQEFFKKIKAKYSNLSIYDLRLCAYLRIGLTSREIADILQVLPSSINVSRSRLRKKLNLSPNEDLYEFLNKF